jgi:uncharacterized membrane protein YqhA
MNDESKTIDPRDAALSRRIMRRIYLVAAIRLLIHPAFLKALIAIVFFWRSTAYVSYRHVIANAPNLFDVKRDIGFYSAALMGAEGVTIALLAAVLILVAWGSYDVFGKRSQAWL